MRAHEKITKCRRFRLRKRSLAGAHHFLTPRTFRLPLAIKVAIEIHAARVESAVLLVGGGGYVGNCESAFLAHDFVYSVGISRRNYGELEIFRDNIGMRIEIIDKRIRQDDAVPFIAAVDAADEDEMRASLSIRICAYRAVFDGCANDCMRRPRILYLDRWSRGRWLDTKHSVDKRADCQNDKGDDRYKNSHREKRQHYSA